MDIRTLFVTSTVISIFLSVASYIYWRTQKTYSGYQDWIVSNFCVLVVYLLFSLRDVLPDLITIPLPQALAVLAAILRWRGLRKFFGEPSARDLLFAWPLISLAVLIYFTFVNDSALIRNLVFTGVITYIVARTIITLGKNASGEWRPLFSFFGGLYGVYSLALVTRAVVWFVSPADRALFAPTITNIVYMVAVPLIEISWAAAFMMMNSQRMETDLGRLRRMTEELAATDPLTGINNRRRFFDIGENEIQRARRNHRPLSVLMMDVNEFKQINDENGHAAGDTALCQLTKILQENMHQSEMVARLGGDEFAILLPETNLEEATQVIQRLRHSIQAVPLHILEREFVLSLSIGAAQLQDSDRTLDDVLSRADISMFQEKKQTRAAVLQNNQSPL